MISSLADTDKIEQLIKSTKFLTRLFQKQSHWHYYKMISEYYERLRDARNNGDFVVAHTMFIPVEIFHALNIVPMHLEFTGYMLSLFSGSCNDVLTKAAEIGLAPEICSGHRLISGALAINVLPPANAVVASNLVCDNAIKSGEFTMECNLCPGILFDYPFHQNQAGKEYVIRELNELINFLEHASGHKMDWDKLSESVEQINRQIRLITEINGLCKTVPSPFQPQDFLKFLAIDYMFAGMPELTEYLEAMRDELARNATEGKGFANPERLRLMGLMIPPWHLQGDVDAILKEHDAAIVCYPNLCDWGEEMELDPSNPLESVARKLADCPPLRTYGPMDERALDPLRQGVRDYKIDGAVNFCHLGCRQMGPATKIFRDVLEEMDVPTVNIDCDLVDRTVTTEEEVRKSLEQFFELLEDR